MRVGFDFGRLDSNHHDWRPKPGLKCEWPRYESSRGHVKRSCFSIVPLGRDMWVISEGRKLLGRRLWIYGPSGACVSFDAYLLFDRSPYRQPSRYAPRPPAENSLLGSSEAEDGQHKMNPPLPRKVGSK